MKAGEKSRAKLRGSAGHRAGQSRRGSCSNIAAVLFFMKAALECFFSTRPLSLLFSLPPVYLLMRTDTTAQIPSTPTSLLPPRGGKNKSRDLFILTAISIFLPWSSRRIQTDTSSPLGPNRNTGLLTSAR